MWSTAIHDTQTGNLLLEVDPASGSWGQGDVTERSHAFKLDDDGLDRDTRHELFRPWDRTLVQRWNGKPAYAGLITGAPYSRDKRELSVKHTSVRAMLARRHLFGVGSYSPSGTVTCSNLSRRGIARRLLYTGLVYPFSAGRPLPVNLPAEEAGAQSRTFFHYDFQTIESLVASLEGEQGGPDIDLRPVYDGNGKLSWDARIGAPFLDGPSFETVLSADSTATGVNVATNADKQASGMFARGRGSEQDMRLGSYSSGSGISKDFSVSFKDVDNVEQLNSLAVGAQEAVAVPRVQWSMSVRADEFPPDQIMIGSTVTTLCEGDPWIEDGPIAHRIIGFSGGLNETINLDLEGQ